MLMRLCLGVFFAVTVSVSSCTIQGGTGTVTLTVSPSPSASPSASPTPSPTPTNTPTPTPQPTMPYTVMIGQSFACGTTSNGSLANPNDASPALNANASAALNGTHPIIIVDENPGPQTTPYAPSCTAPPAWGAQYLLRFASYSDLQSAATTPGVLPTTAPGVPLFAYIMYDNEPNASPTTNPTELATNSPYENGVPAYYYYEASQTVAALPGPPIFMATAGTFQASTAQKNELWATAGYWGAWDAQSQQSESTLSSWQSSWGANVTNLFTYNRTLPVFLGVGQVLSNDTEATQAQLDAVMQNVPPNFSGVWMNLNQQTPSGGTTIPNGYGLGAQAIVDTADAGISATPYPIPTSTTAATPPPAPTATPTASPTATPPQVAATLCIGQANGAGLKYTLASHDEFNQDLALNTASPVPSDLNVSDTYPAAAPPSIGSGVVQTTWSNSYPFGHQNGGLAGVDDSYYPTRAQLTTWQGEYGASNYPYTIQLDPGVGVKLLAYPVALYHPTISAAYSPPSPTLAANYTAGSTTVSVSSATGIMTGMYASIVCIANSGCPSNRTYQYDTNFPTVTAVSGTTVTLSGTGFAYSYIDNPNGGTQTIVFSSPTISVSSAANLAVGQILSFSGTAYDNLNPTITAISGTTLTISPGFVSSHASGQLMSVTPADIASSVCFGPTYCLHNLAGLMDGNINNAYEYGYWVYGTVSVPDGSTAYQGSFPSDWTLCETTCNGSGNNYYEMDTFEVYSTLFGVQGYGHQTLQPENATGVGECNPATNNPIGCGGPMWAQYTDFTDNTIATAPHTWSEVSYGTPGTPTSGGVWFMKDNQASLALPLSQVPAANVASNPGVSPIMVHQTCWWGSYCKPGVNPTASPLVLEEQYYRHYAPTTTSCGPPYDVPPPPSPTPVPTAPPTTNPAVAPTLAAKSAADYNSAGYGGLYGVLGTATGTSGSITSTAGDDLVAVVTAAGNISVPTGWTQLPTSFAQPVSIFWCKVGSGTGQCPAANSWNFGGDNHGGLVHVYEFAQAGTPVISSASSQVFAYGSTASSGVNASLSIPATNGLTLVVSGAMLAGATTTTVTSFTDSITGSLTAGTAIDDVDLNQTTSSGGGQSIASLRTLSINQDAGASGIQPVLNNQVVVTNTGGGIAFGNYFVFIPHS